MPVQRKKRGKSKVVSEKPIEESPESSEVEDLVEDSPESTSTEESSEENLIEEPVEETLEESEEEAPAKKTAKKTPAKKVAKKNTPTKKEPAKKAVKKAPAKKVAKKTPAKKAVKKAPAKKVAKKTPAKAPAKASTDEKKKRFFKIVLNSIEPISSPDVDVEALNSKGGRYTGHNPMQAAKKACRRIARAGSPKGECCYVFSVQETTQGSAKKTFRYVGERVKLENPSVIKKGDATYNVYFDINVRSYKGPESIKRK